MARILHLSTVHPASDPRILEKQAAAMVAAGHDVTVIARESTGLGDRGLDLGVVIDPLPVAEGRRERLIDQLGLQARIDGYAPDLVVVHDPELLPFANWLKRAPIKVVYDAHEDLPLQLLSKPWIPEWARTPAAMAAMLSQKPLMARLDGLMAATEPVAESLGLPATVVRNYPDLRALPKPRAVKDREKILAYVGALSEIRGLFEMLDLLEQLPDYRLRLVGRWESDALKRSAQAHPAWDRVEATGPLPHGEALEAVGTASLGLCLLHSRPNYLEALPTKLFEYMALGIPVLASNFRLWREIVEEAGCGAVADPQKPASVLAQAKGVLRARGLGRKGRKAVEQRYNWQGESERLLRFIDSLL